MAELFGVVVIAVSALMLFALSTLQLAHRLADGRLDPLSRTFVLPELDDVPLSVVAGFTAAVAVCSQVPVAYLIGLHAGQLSAPAVTFLVLEVVAALAWTADLAGARRSARSLFRRYTERRSLAS